MSMLLNPFISFPASGPPPSGPLLAWADFKADSYGVGETTYTS
jgi:hypothetical protein